MIYLKAFVYSFLATLGFAILFHSPKRSILPACLSSGLSWLVYEYLQISGVNYIFSAFASAFLIGIFGEFLSRRLKNPATVFILPGLIPLVPGAGMYYSMNSLINQDYNSFMAVGVKTFFTALALSFGLVVSSTFSNSLRHVRERKQNSRI